MARRKKETRVTTQRSSQTERPTPATTEDIAQRRQFLMWTAIITLVMVAIIYFALFR